MATKAHLEGNKRYLEKLDHITIRVQGGTKEKIKARAQQKGMSLNAYIVYLIEKDMKTEPSKLDTWVRFPSPAFHLPIW